MGTEKLKVNIKKRKQIVFYIMEKRPDLDEQGIIDFLYFLDFDWYEKTDKYLTGTRYRKRKDKIWPLLFRFEKPDLKCLSKKEKEFIDQMFKRFSNKTSKEISEFSRKDIPYIKADKNEFLCYDSVFYRTDEYSVRDYGDDKSIKTNPS